MPWQRRGPSPEDFVRLREQRDAARRQRDQLRQRLKRLRDQLAHERSRPLQPPYGWLNPADHEQPPSSPEPPPGVAGPRPDLIARADSTERCWPSRLRVEVSALDPGPDVAFVTVANDRFFPGVEALILSILDVYPRFSSPFLVLHDGSLTPFHRDHLSLIYPGISFDVPQPAWGASLPLDSPNRERIGLLGYLNIYALSLEGYRRVIVLDSDVLVMGALDALWAEGPAFRAVIDCGARPYGLISPQTGIPIINSGVISIPGWALGSTLLERIQQLIESAGDPFCPLLDGFADQRIWNQLLADQPLELMPINFNCNIKYLVQYLEGGIEGLSLIHFAGPKPWLRHEQPRSRSKSITDHWLWIRHHRVLLYRELLRQYRNYLVQNPIDAWPTDASSLPSGGDRLALDPEQLLSAAPLEGRHLIVHSPGQFGARWDCSPGWPPGWWDHLQQLALHDTVHLWAPFGLRPVLEKLKRPAGVQCHYILLELPFSASTGDDDRFGDPAGFAPWQESAELSMVQAVRRRLSGAQSDPARG